MPEDPLNPIHPHPQALLLAVWIADGDVASERAFAKAIQALSWGRALLAMLMV